MISDLECCLVKLYAKVVGQLEIELVEVGTFIMISTQNSFCNRVLTCIFGYRLGTLLALWSYLHR